MKRVIEHLRENGLKYGFETLVITAGILLAFGLNNWNEGKKTKQLEIDMIRSLISTTEANLRDEVGTGQGELDIAKSAKILQEVIDNDLHYHDSLAKHFGLIGGYHDLWIDYSAFEMLKNSNYVLISSDSLREQVRSYYSVALPAAETIQEMRQRRVKDMFKLEWIKSFEPFELTNFEELKKDQMFNLLISYQIPTGKAWGKSHTDSTNNSYQLLLSLREELERLEGQ